MSIRDLCEKMGSGSMLVFFHDEFLMHSGRRGSSMHASDDFSRAYDILYGYLWSLRDQGVITAADFESVVFSLRREAGMAS